MKRREITLLLVGLVLMAGAAAALVALKSNQRLGQPGLKATAIPNSGRMKIELPMQLAGYEVRERDDVETRKALNSLPPDTSMVQALYKELPGGPEIQTFVVMMGSDRTSIHKPQFCLTGAGWSIDDRRSERVTVRVERPEPVDLPVMKLIANRKVEVNGQQMDYSGVFVYWFVADNAVTTGHWTRVSWMAKHLLTTGELQRWAYIAYFAPCPPGQEEETFRRISRLMNAAVPQYQLAWP